MSMGKYNLSFYDNWINEKSEMDLVPLLDGLVGKKFRFRDNAADRKKNYQFHSPASTIVEKIRIWNEEWSSFFNGHPVEPMLLICEETKMYDRFLAFKVAVQNEGKSFACAYITLKIKPCKVEPKKLGGIEDGSEMTGYDIDYQKGCSEATIHSLMLVEPKRYCKWLEEKIMSEYTETVKAVAEDKELSEPFAVIRYLTDKAEEDVHRARKLTGMEI